MTDSERAVHNKEVIEEAVAKFRREVVRRLEETGFFHVEVTVESQNGVLLSGKSGSFEKFRFSPPGRREPGKA